MLAEKKKRHGKYNKYSSKERAALGKFASENGTQASSLYSSTIKENYHEELA